MIPNKDSIAGFDFEANVVLIKTGKVFNGEAVHEVLPLGDMDKQVICDAWSDWRYREEGQS